MILMEIGPNVTIEHSSDLRSRDIDQNHDWLSDGKQDYDNSKLADTYNFLQQATEHKENDKKIGYSSMEIVDYDSLNEKQEIIFK